MLGLDKELIKQIFGWTGTGLAIIFFITPVVPICKLVNEQKKIKLFNKFLVGQELD